VSVSKRQPLFSEITHLPDTLHQKIYPGLNGLRGVSIIMVVLHHFILQYNGYYQNVLFIGYLGVDIFFVISGFLITTLCIKEKVKTNTISLKKFYIRRAFRILPVAYLYIATLLVLNYIFKLDIAYTSFIGAALFLMNLSVFWSAKFDWDLAHYWTLSTEEQFYILFPILLKKRLSVFTGVVIFVAAVVPLLFYLQYLFPVLNIGIVSSALRYFIKFQGIAIGCLFSILLCKGYLNSGRYNVPVTLFCILFIAYFKFDPATSLKSSFLNLFISVAIGFIIVNNVLYTNNWIANFLNFKPLAFVGVLSYSIYIWQQLFMSHNPKFPLSAFPVNMLCLSVVPVLVYFTFEKYFLKLRNRFKSV
jgi:peptidoglycan/LPS O-acetylase OafA/YrhL